MPDGIPAIVPKNLFDRVQEKLAKNQKAPARHKSEDDYLLTPKLYCGKCKSFMVGESGTGRNKVHRYYKCASVKNHKGCDKKTVKKDWIEILVIKVIKDIISDDNLINDLADTLIEALGKESTVLPLLKKQLSDVEKSIYIALMKLSTSRFLCSKLVVSSLRKRVRQNTILSLSIGGLTISSCIMQTLKSLFCCSSSSSLSFVDLMKMPCWIAFSILYLFDDRIVFTFNYKDGSRTITFVDIENSDLCSDLTSLGAPKE